MFLPEKLSSIHSRNIPKKVSKYLSSLVAILCAGVISGSSVRNEVPSVPSYEGEEKFFSPVVETQELVQYILLLSEAKQVALKKQQERNAKMMAEVPMNDHGIFWMRIFRDLHLDAGIMMNLIKRESGGLTQATSTKGAKGIMQVKDIVLDDMRGVAGVKKYGKYFLSITPDTIAKMTNEADKEKLTGFQNLIHLIQSSGDTVDEAILNEYNNFLFSFRTDLYNPDLNVVFGSVLIRYLQKYADSSEKILQEIEGIVQSLDDKDIQRINQLRSAKGVPAISENFDFSLISPRQILTLVYYNTGTGGKNRKSGVLYAIAILA